MCAPIYGKVCPCGRLFNTVLKDREYCDVCEDARKENKDGFESWWKDFTSKGIIPNNPICALKPLYEKMKEWGYAAISINFDQSSIGVWISTGNLQIQEDEAALCNNFCSIHGFPRALHDAFKWMYEHRVKKPKLKCDKDGGCDKWKEWIGPIDYERLVYCPYCGEKR